MASTNEDAVVLATARIDAERFLIVRQLPDRGTVEIGWWRGDEAGTTEQLQVLELAAEAAEVGAFARLCHQVVDAGWDAIGDREEIAAAGPFTDGAELAAMRSGDEVTFVRRPERDGLIRMSRAEVSVLATKLPTAIQKLTTFGFGQVQHEE